MMDSVRNWILGVVAVGLLVSLCQSLSPEGKTQKVSRFCGGLLLFLAVVTPIVQWDITGTLQAFQDYCESLTVSQEEVAQAGSTVLETQVCPAHPAVFAGTSPAAGGGGDRPSHLQDPRGHPRAGCGDSHRHPHRRSAAAADPVHPGRIRADGGTDHISDERNRMKGFTWNSKAVLQFFQKNRWTALLLLVGLALLLWPTGGTGDNSTPAATEQRQQYEYDLESLEEKLADTLSQVDGAGKTQVVLTLATTGSVELAENQTSKDGSVETQVVVVKKGSNQEDVVEVAQQYPAFLGALVVSDGGGDPQVKLDLLQAVKALTGLGSDQISICERSGGNES